MRQKYIAVDFDGTICEHRYPELGAPKHEVINAMCQERCRGTKMIIWTCRPSNDPDMLKFLREWNVPYDAINENPWFTMLHSPKIYADEYWDDRARQIY